MKNNIDNKLEKPEVGFVSPDVEAEIGEIERVAETFAPDSKEEFAATFIEKAQTTELVDLTDDLWEKLENTDSFDIPVGGWDQVNEHVTHENANTGASRSWESLKSKVEQGVTLDAPIIVKVGETLHLVSGNTRLMTARAMGVRPKVLIVEM